MARAKDLLISAALLFAGRRRTHLPRGLARAAPVGSVGPAIDMDPFCGTPWRHGRRLVDEEGRPYRADEIEEDDFYTAFPQGADREELGSPLVVVRLPKGALALPPP